MRVRSSLQVSQRIAVRSATVLLTHQHNSIGVLVVVEFVSIAVVIQQNEVIEPAMIDSECSSDDATTSNPAA